MAHVLPAAGFALSLAVRQIGEEDAQNTGSNHNHPIIRSLVTENAKGTFLAAVPAIALSS
jgi:hypothetical protein